MVKVVLDLTVMTISVAMFIAGLVSYSAGDVDNGTFWIAVSISLRLSLTEIRQ